MKTSIAACAIGLILCQTVSAYAPPQPPPSLRTANAVMRGCRAALDPHDTSNPYRQGLCDGLILATLYWAYQISSPSFCLPAGVNTKQIERVVVKYIDDRPERQNENFTDLAAEALRAAWPCQH
jgi:hypothetical protein